MAKPTVVFIPGLWEGPTVFSSLSTLISSPPHSLPTHLCTLPSTGQVSPHNSTLQADVASIRSQIKPLIDGEKEIILVMHSAGGFLGSNAVEGWALKQRKEEGNGGGVKALVYLAAGLLPEGAMHSDLPFMEKDGTGRMTCVSPLQSLFSDLSPATAQHWLTKLQPQPAEGWNDIITYGAWKDIPSIYLLAEEDKVLPPEIQEQCAGLAGSEVVRVQAGHMLMLSQEEMCLEVILKAVAGLGRGM